MTISLPPPPDFAAIARALPAGAHIVLHSAFAEPGLLAGQLFDHLELLRGVTLHNLMSFAEPAYAAPDIAAQIHIETFFPGPGLRRAVNQGLVQIRRCALSDIPRLFAAGALGADLLLLQVSPPDDRGRVSLGISVDYMPEVIACRPVIVAQLNPNMPFTSGQSTLPLAAIDYLVEAESPLLELPLAAADAIDTAIARQVAGLIRDGDVIQAGIGALPDAVLANLGHLRHLGAHSGILTSAWRPLLESGVVDNSTRRDYPGLCTTTMAGGDAGFYRYLHRHPAIHFAPVSVTHAPATLAAVARLCAINSVLQLDLGGRANAESAGGRVIANPGGLPDFANGARAAPGGRSIVALRSSFSNGQISNIVPSLGAGATVTLEASAIDYVVTEYGVAAIGDKGPEARAQALLAIAHPDHREALARAWRDGA